MLIGGIALVVFGVIMSISAMRSWHDLRRLRRRGLRVSGEVVDVDVHDFYSFTPTRPIARYAVDGRTHDGIVGNYRGKAELHTNLDLLVDASDPSTAIAAYGNVAASAALTGLVVVVVGLAFCVGGR